MPQLLICRPHISDKALILSLHVAQVVDRCDVYSTKAVQEEWTLSSSRCARSHLPTHWFSEIKGSKPKASALREACREGCHFLQQKFETGKGLGLKRGLYTNEIINK